MPKFRDISNQRFGRLIAIKPSGKNRDGGYKWVCQCDCGEMTIVRSSQKLMRGQTMSCGCLRGELLKTRSITHGDATGGNVSIEYESWRNLKARCYNKNDTGYPRYGGRGITVCERWLESFSNFLSDMGRKPSREYSIDRENNDGNYEPGNCRWATARDQALNTRRTRMFTLGDKTQCLTDWAADIGICAGTLSDRLKRYPVEIALTAPKGKIKHALYKH